MSTERKNERNERVSKRTYICVHCTFIFHSFVHTNNSKHGSTLICYSMYAGSEWMDAWKMTSVVQAYTHTPTNVRAVELETRTMMMKATAMAATANADENLRGIKQGKQ